MSGVTVLQVIPHLSAGGAERTVIEIAEALKAAGARALVASCGGRLEGELARAGGELMRISTLSSKNPLTIYGNAGALAGIISQQAVDIVHARSRAPAWSALWAARRTRKPFVTTYHGVYNARSAIKRWYNSIMARGDVVIANSSFTAAHIRRQHKDASQRIITIPRGVDIARFSREALTPERTGALAASWGLPASGGEAVILLPARMTGWKGHREAIEAAAILRAEAGQPWRMIFAGDPQGRSGYTDELKDLIRGHNLGDRIAMVGHCEDMPAAFALADIVIAPSNEPEAFGRVAAEAGAMGVPVIGSDIGGQAEIIVHGETGLVVPPGDAGALAGAMARLLAMPGEARARMGAAARARIRSSFTTAALQTATLSVYDRLMSRSA